METGPALECVSLTKSFRRRKVLDGLELTVMPGEILGLTGENGSGKSTLLRCVAGYERIDSGAARLSGRLGYCPQEDCLEERIRLGEHMDLIASACARAGGLPAERRAELVDRFALGGQRRERAGNLSGGSRQKLKFLLALLPAPELLLLDEAYEGFDFRTYEAFWLTLGEFARGGTAVLLASHLAHERERFSRILEISGGRLIDA
jgi:ABC-2 type transport system ATP-binding protein